MKTYVINLDKYKHRFDKQKPILESVGLNVERFNAIDAINNEHLKYKNNINTFAMHFTPKTVLCCGLSHILLANYINKYENNKSYVLIMEDDAFPLIKDETKFQNELNKTVNDIYILDSNWDIIQLHSDACYPCFNTYFTHALSGSSAAYLLSNKGAIKLANDKVISHIDLHTSMNKKYRKYKAHHNLFWTDENTSTNRIENRNYLLKIKEKILTCIISLRGEKTWGDLLSFKLLRLPIINKEFNADQLINYFFAYLIIKKFYLIK